MEIPDATSPLAIGFFIAAVTQWAKDLGAGGDAYGIHGFYLKAIATATGIFAAIMVNFQPELWTSIYLAMTGATVTGTVSLLQDLIKKIKTIAGN